MSSAKTYFLHSWDSVFVLCCTSWVEYLSLSRIKIERTCRSTMVSSPKPKKRQIFILIFSQCMSFYPSMIMQVKFRLQNFSCIRIQKVYGTTGLFFLTLQRLQIITVPEHDVLSRQFYTNSIFPALPAFLCLDAFTPLRL